MTEKLYSLQKITSAATSVNSKKVPRLFSLVKDWQSGTRNLDYGGGRYDTATEYLAARGVTNCIYDPYNRSQEENRKVMNFWKYDTCTISNVLNVIKEKEMRSWILADAILEVRNDAKIYVTVYEGNGSGVGCLTKKDCWQNNQPISFYEKEIREEANKWSSNGGLTITVERKGPLIIVTPHADESKLPEIVENYTKAHAKKRKGKRS